MRRVSERRTPMHNGLTARRMLGTVQAGGDVADGRVQNVEFHQHIQKGAFEIIAKFIGKFVDVDVTVLPNADLHDEIAS